MARRLLASAAQTSLEEPAYPFVESALLTARAGHEVPHFKDPRRSRVAELCWAAAASDVERALALGEAEWVHPIRDAVLTRVAPEALLDCAPTLLAPIVHAKDEAIAMARLAAMADGDLSPAVLVEATLVALDRGLDAAPFLRRWVAPDASGDDEAAHFWRAAEVRRLARVDLAAGLEKEAALPGRWKHDEHASLAIAARLARVDPDAAFERAIELGPDLDHVGWLRGCVVGGIPRAEELVDMWIDDLGPGTYDPHFYTQAVLEACLELGDGARARRCLDAGGPTGWQVAHAARWGLSRSAAPDPLLEVLLDRYEPGVVAGRAVERRGFPFMAGKAVIRPEWLDIAEPHPVETLSIVAALGAEGPVWEWDWLP